MSPRRSLVALVLIAVPVLAGCGAGRDTVMESQRTTPFVGNANAGSIAVRAVRLVVASPTAAAAASPTGGPQAYLMASIVNRGRSVDELTNATVTGGAVQPIGADATSLSLPPGELVQFGNPDLGTSGPTLGVGAPSTAIRPGTTTTVSFTFRTAGTVTLDVPVQTTSDIGTTDVTSPVVS